MQPQEIKNLIDETIISVLKYTVQKDSLTEETNMLNDLNLDSFAYIQLIVDLENMLGFEMDDEILDIEAVQIYKDFVDAILKKATQVEVDKGGEVP